MFIFIDESGDLGFQFQKSSSKYFILTAIVFDSYTHSIEATNILNNLRQDLLLPYNFEFHFTKNKSSIREAVLKEIEKMTFTWFGVCIQKEKIWSDKMKSSDYLLQEVSKYLHSNLGSRLDNAKIIYDKGKSKNFYTNLKTYLCREFNTNGKTKIKDVKGEDSARNSLLQIADYCCSSLAQYEKNTEYGNKIYKVWRKTKGHYQHWPK